MAATNVQRFSGDVILSGNMNLQKVSNTATIKLDSNVVTEFPRSKKLIKYPRVALNSASQDSYVVTSSTDAYDNTYFHRYDPFRPFVSGSAMGWHTGPPHTSTPNSWDQTFDTSGYNKNITSYGSGGYAGTSIAEIESEWLKLELPHKIVLSHFFYQQRDGQSENYHQAPKDFRILGSNDDIDWDTIETFTGQASHPDGQTLTAEATKGYKYLAFVVTATQTPTGTSGLTLKNLEYYGIPEYDPEAHGTDVTVKSYPNVPNTDWLEVYYDAKGLEDNSTTVNDLKPVGTANNGVANGNLSVSDGAFTFDGSGDYIEGTFSGHTLSSGYTMATWIKPGEIGVDDYIATFGVGNTGTSFGINFETVGGAFRAFIWGPSTPGIVAKTGPGAVTKNEWVHIAATFISATGSIHLYIDNKLVATGTGTTISSISASGPLILGARNSNGTIQRHANFTMANFRLFNRALTSDEIYQLYAYQKEDFGHGDLSMTLKAGRLGIGTSEPKAALDVKGGIAVHGIMTTFTSQYTCAYPVTSISPDIWAVAGDSNARIGGGAISYTSGISIKYLNSVPMWFWGGDDEFVDIRNIIAVNDITWTIAIAIAKKPETGMVLCNQVNDNELNAHTHHRIQYNGGKFNGDEYGPTGNGWNVRTTGEVQISDESVVVVKKNGNGGGGITVFLNGHLIGGGTNAETGSGTNHKTRLGRRTRYSGYGIDGGGGLHAGIAAYAAWDSAIADVDIVKYMTYQSLTGGSVRAGAGGY